VLQSSMNAPKVDSPSYRGHRFPRAIISHGVWLYFRFSLSYRDVEEMMAERGIVVSYESIREWCLKFGAIYSKRIRSRRGRLGDRWHLDEMLIRVNGRLQYLWRAVDHEGEVLDILVQPRRDKRAARKFFRKLLKGMGYVPRVIVTDKLRSYAAAKFEVMPSVAHHQGKWLNNRAENSHESTREREHRMRGFKSAGQAQRFLAVFGVITSFFRPGRHLLTARNYREIIGRRFTEWRRLVGLQVAI
jgi:putative transposase